MLNRIKMNLRTGRVKRLIMGALCGVFALSAHVPMAYAELQTGLDLVHDGVDRQYDLYQPDSAPAGNLPLVIDMHGLTLSPGHQRLNSGFRELAMEQGFFVAWPRGVNAAWNVSPDNLPPGIGSIDDVGFLLAMIDEVTANHPIDTRKIYVTGFSLGGAMAYRLLCDTDGVIAAASTVAGPIGEDTPGLCNPGGNVPILSFHGTTDTLVPYNGGLAGGFGGLPEINILSAADVFQFWRQANTCSGPVNRQNLGSDSFCDTDTNCAQDSEVTYCTVTGIGDPNGHLIYLNSDNIDLGQRSWDFFSQFSLPEAEFAIDAGLNGNWWNGPARNGEGAQIEVADAGNGSLVFVATFYGYSPQGDQIFLVAVGSVTGNTAEVDVFITDGGMWGDGFDPANVNQPQWGTGTFTASGCDAMTMSLRPNAQFQGMGYTDLAYDLVRLTTPIIACPQ